MKVFYRISDKGNPKEKIPQADKQSCLRNAIAEFGVENIYVIADNCKRETVAFIANAGLKHEETSLGNSASFRYIAERIITTLGDDERVYLLEDDYVHLPNALGYLEEGLTLGDYVTLYDHPDKYVPFAENGNPFNFNKLHATRLYVTAHSHWAEVNSTTMTFACTVRTLREDLPVWTKFTQSRNPKDFKAFMELTQSSPSDALSFLFRGKKGYFLTIMKNWLSHKKIRKVVSAIPARATHAEVKFLAPVIDWTQATK